MATRDELVDIPVGGQRIAGTLVSPRTSLPGVLFIHGWGGSRQQYLARARELAIRGSICLTFDLRGHEQSKALYETVTREENLSDVLAAYDVLVAQRSVDAGRIAVVGSSYGGYLAALLTALRPVQWLALRAPALYKDSEWDLAKRHLKVRQDLAAYRMQPVRPEDSRALRACAGFAGDVLIVESEHDTVVPHQVIVNYRHAFTAARSATHHVLEGADHGLIDAASQQAYTAVLIRWLAEKVLGPCMPGATAPAQAPASPSAVLAGT
jgi:dienelactone hydrolase